jgi:ABC-type bacteriocin/lantibiotic exporter with double-glycine peptidase domain
MAWLRGRRRMRSNLAWIFKYVKEMKWLYVLCIVLAALDMMTSLGTTLIQKWLIDDIFMEKQYDRLIPLVLGFAALVVSYNAVHLASYMVNHRNQQLFRERISHDMMNYFYRIPVRKYQNERIGKFVNYLANDVNSAASTISGFIPNGIVSTIRVIILVGIVGFASPVILVAATVLCTAYIGLGKYYGHRFKTMAKSVAEARSEVTVQIEEGISSTREVVAFQRLGWEEEKYNKSFNKYFNLVMADGKMRNKEMAMLEPFKWAVTLLAFGYGGYQVIQGTMSVGTFVVLFQFAGQLVGAYESLYNFYTRFSRKMGDIERIRDLIESGTEKSQDAGRKISGSIDKVEFQNVWFRYSDETDYVLRNLSLEVPVGKKAAFVGASGGGKSTIAQLLVRFFGAERGAVLVNGVPLEEIKESNWRSRVRIVFQEPYLFPDTIRNNRTWEKAIRRNS